MLNSLNKSDSKIGYDKWHEVVHGGENPAEISLAQWHENSLSLSPSLDGLKVLEVGCGVGDFALYLASQNANVSAVDFSDKAISIAKEKAKAQGKQVEFSVADAQALTFEDNTFDLLFSCECLEHLPDPERALSEFYRVLKPSGRLILTTENYSNGLLIIWLFCWLRKVPFDSGAGVQPIEQFFLYWQVRKIFKKVGFKVERMMGTHHVFLLLPKLHPHTFVKEKFKNPFAATLFRPLARHMAFDAVKE